MLPTLCQLMLNTHPSSSTQSPEQAQPTIRIFSAHNLKSASQTPTARHPVPFVSTTPQLTSPQDKLTIGNSVANTRISSDLSVGTCLHSNSNAAFPTIAAIVSGTYLLAKQSCGPAPKTSQFLVCSAASPVIHRSGSNTSGWGNTAGSCSAG